MTRDRLTSSELLSRIESVGGRAARSAAAKLLELGDDVGGQRIGRHQAVSLRLAGPIRGEHEWVTLFVVSTAGTAYVNWLDRWEWIGLSPAVAERFRRDLVTAFGATIQQRPSTYKNGVSVLQIAQKWPEFERAVRRAADVINASVRQQILEYTAAPDLDTIKDFEGQITETQVLRRSRSNKLRLEALTRSGGVCAGCSTNYGAMLGGRGWRVLQVHHKQQLSDRDEPQVTELDDLAVVCANCHMLIHADREAALEVEAVAALWRQYRTATREGPS